MILNFNVEIKNVDCSFNYQDGYCAVTSKTRINIELVEKHDSEKDVTKKLYQELIDHLTNLLNSEATK